MRVLVLCVSGSSFGSYKVENLIGSSKTHTELDCLSKVDGDHWVTRSNGGDHNHVRDNKAIYITLNAAKDIVLRFGCFIRTCGQAASFYWNLSTYVQFIVVFKIVQIQTSFFSNISVLISNRILLISICKTHNKVKVALPLRFW